MMPARRSPRSGPREDFVKTVRKSKNAALVWKEAPAAKGASYIVPT